MKTGQAVTFQTEEDEQGRLLAKEVYPADPEKETGPKEELWYKKHIFVSEF